MRCTACGTEAPPGMVFCGTCGSRLAKPCPSCGFESPEGFRFCGRCGSSLETTSARPIPEAAPVPARGEEERADRRLVTVMFADLVESTALSERLDPEELRDLVRRYQEVAERVVSRFGGSVAQYLGDGILVYFGYPRAHEDDARRAVLTGLGLVDALAGLNQRLERELGLTIAVRVGIHTGLVVAGLMGAGGHQERLALGHTPNLAARLQGLARPNAVVLSFKNFLNNTASDKVVRLLAAGQRAHRDHRIVVTRVLANSQRGNRLKASDYDDEVYHNRQHRAANENIGEGFHSRALPEIEGRKSGAERRP